ncbi:MAG: cysteine hydrolase, partial [Hylemonella sp.]
MKTALLLIDIQESFRHRPYWSGADLPDFLAANARLIEG